MSRTEKVFDILNARLIEEGVEPLTKLVQANNLGGIISNVFTAQLDRVSPYKRKSDQAHPDLENLGIGLEIKSANRAGKGGESHNGHTGWHIIACYDTERETGRIVFIHIMVAELIGYERGEIDWKLLQSTHDRGRTGHIETYSTTPQGRAKLLDGTVYLDTERVPNWKRWRRKTLDAPIPPYSIFHDARQNLDAA